jgi:hypothetical protein
VEWFNKVVRWAVQAGHSFNTCVNEECLQNYRSMKIEFVSSTDYDPFVVIMMMMIIDGYLHTV